MLRSSASIIRMFGAAVVLLPKILTHFLAFLVFLAISRAAKDSVLAKNQTHGWRFAKKGGANALFRTCITYFLPWTLTNTVYLSIQRITCIT